MRTYSHSGGTKFPLAPRFRDRWYLLSPEQVLQYIRKISPEDVQIIDTYCGQLTMDFGCTISHNRR